MFCDACGARNRAGARFCKECGASIGVLPEDGAVGATQELPAKAVEARVPEEVRRGLGASYEVLRVLGHGGMGTVYLATERTLERPVAVKVLRRSSGDESRAVQRFLQEARLAARLRHPGIVSIHSVGSSPELYYFTMDYIEGETLCDLVERQEPRGLDPARARAILRDIVEAVAHAHEQGVIHRDLKPGNIMVDRSGHVLVLDFGLAKAQTATALTNSGVVVGTPQYICPEHLQGKPATAQGDTYALGLIHYFMLAGEDLVQGESVPPVVIQHLSGAPATRAGSDPRLAPFDARLIQTMVQKDPAKRPSMADVLRTLASAPPGTPPPVAAPAPEPVAAVQGLRVREALRGHERERAVSERSPARARELLGEARDLFRRGDYDAALALYARAVSEDHRSPQAWLGQILCLLSLSQIAEAEAWSDRALGRLPDDPDILAAKAVAVGRRGDVAGAIALSDRSMVRGDGSGFVWWARGDVLAGEDPDAAWSAFERARELAKGDPETLLWIAKTRLSMGEPEEALQDLVEANAADEGHAMVWYHLGVAHRELAQFREAQEAFDRAVALCPSNPDAQKALREIGATGWLHRGLRKLQVRMKGGRREGE